MGTQARGGGWGVSGDSSLAGSSPGAAGAARQLPSHPPGPTEEAPLSP